MAQNFVETAWIERLFAEGITAGCGGGNFCPGAAVSRGQAAAFIVRTFGLSETRRAGASGMIPRR